MRCTLLFALSLWFSSVAFATEQDSLKVLPLLEQSILRTETNDLTTTIQKVKKYVSIRKEDQNRRLLISVGATETKDVWKVWSLRVRMPLTTNLSIQGTVGSVTGGRVDLKVPFHKIL